MNEPPARNNFRKLARAYGAFFLTMVLVLVAVSLVLSARGPLSGAGDPQPGIQKGVAIALAIVIIPLAYGYPQKMMRRVEPRWTLDLKVALYRRAVVLRLAMTASVFLVNAFLFLATGDNDLLLLLAIILLFFILSRPTPFRAATDLGLSDGEKAELF